MGEQYLDEDSMTDWSGPAAIKRHDVFIAGETTDLCAPTEISISQGWASWFNNPSITKHLGQGVFTNDDVQQRQFLEGIRAGSRFALMICGKGGAPMYGIISLSMINWTAKSAQIAIVVGEKVPPRQLMQLEAMALVARHAFEKMGLERIWAGQAFPGLQTFNEHLELLGYRVEGVLRRGFAKGREASNSVVISCLYEDYKRLVDRRGGNLWPGNDRMFQIIRKRPKPGLGEKLSRLIADEQESHFAALSEAEDRC